MAEVKIITPIEGLNIPNAKVAAAIEEIKNRRVKWSD